MSSYDDESHWRNVLFVDINLELKNYNKKVHFTICTT